MVVALADINPTHNETQLWGGWWMMPNPLAVGSAYWGGRTGFTFQMSSAYSRIVRSEENLPLPAVYMMDLWNTSFVCRCLGTRAQSYTDCSGTATLGQEMPTLIL